MSGLHFLKKSASPDLPTISEVLALPTISTLNIDVFLGTREIVDINRLQRTAIAPY